MSDRLHLLRKGNVHILPVLHYRMEFAWLVRRAFDRIRPDCIAVELPAALAPAIVRAIRRLPLISAVSYSSRGSRVHLLVEPADPLAEGCRLAVEHEIDLHFVDLDLGDYPLHRDPVPDSYAVHRIGLAAYYAAFRDAPCAPAPEDLRREQGMAHRLRMLSGKHERILFLCGMVHPERILSHLGGATAAPLDRVEPREASVTHLHPDSCREVLGEYPFLSSLYELLRGPLPPEPQAARPMRTSFGALELLTGGRQELGEEEILTQALHRSVRHVSDPSGFPDRQKILYRLFREAGAHYRQETGERLRHWQRRLFFRYVRNLALLEGMLQPDLFDILTAARSCVDDNFAHACWRLATHYPWQEEDAEIPTVRLFPGDFAAGVRRLRFRPRSRRKEKGLSSLRFLNRKREKLPGEWLKGFDDPSVCSYPPEDLVIEDYGRYLQRRGEGVVSGARVRTEPFTSSLLDGIDLRETLRNIQDGRIYVREELPTRGTASSVVVVFDQESDRRYPYVMTWLGEHDQESDMAFYATDPGDSVVGPGICRAEYGGFLLSSPPRRMADVWSDPDYRFARTRAEVLLLAALDYSRDPLVIYAAPRPPRSVFRTIAASLGKKIVHLPLGSLSPGHLAKLRVFHILFGKDKREIARDYIW